MLLKISKLIKILMNPYVKMANRPRKIWKNDPSYSFGIITFPFI